MQQCLPLAVLKPFNTKHNGSNTVKPLQQCLPLAVLKHAKISAKYELPAVATVLTACGIETIIIISINIKLTYVATVLTACGIETTSYILVLFSKIDSVATVLTACGIETLDNTGSKSLKSSLQQCLPLAVLKQRYTPNIWSISPTLQQCLPLAVLKLTLKQVVKANMYLSVATVLTACGIETMLVRVSPPFTICVATVLTACGIETQRNNTIPLGVHSLQQCLPLAVLKPFRMRLTSNRTSSVATVLTACGIETKWC